MALKKFLLVLGVSLWAITPFAVTGQMTDPVSFSLESAPEQINVDETFEIRIRADIEGKWHLYSVNITKDQGPFPTEFTAESEGFSIDGTVRESEPTKAYDPNFETELGWHSKRADFTIPLKYRPESAAKEALIDVAVRYQVCTDEVCLPPKTKNITGDVQIADASSTSGVPPGSGSTDKSNPKTEEGAQSEGPQTGDQNAKIDSASRDYANAGMLSFLWIAITAGFAALLTPCVFPMLPLTVSFFTKQSHGSNKKALFQAIFFGASIVATFTLIGAVLAAVMGASGANQFAANPWVNLFIALILVVFALSLLGLFELRLPHQLTNWLNRKSDEKSGILGVLFMGLTISAVSFSCTAPFVGAVLAATAGGEWFFPIVGMIAFSAAFSTPFIIFAMFPNWLQTLPESGSWMNVVKVLLGFIELAAAFKFLSNADLVWEWGLVTRPLTIAAWIVIFALAGLYALGYLVIGHEKKKESVSTLRVLVAIPLLTFSIYLIPGLLGSSLGVWDAWLPPKQATDVGVVQSIGAGGGVEGTADHNEGWSDDYEASLTKAQKVSKPVFIDFTGYTCTNCRAMEANVFPKKQVQQNFEKMVKVRLYTDAADVGPRNQKLQFEMTGTVALPTYVIVNPYTEQVVKQRSGYTKTKAFVEFLKSGITDFKSLASKQKSMDR